MEAMVDEQVSALVTTVPDWPVPGVRFTDVSRIPEHHPELFRVLIDRLCEHYRHDPPTVILPTEARGFIYG
ncbi:MAG: hypothetical protein ACRDYE_03020 [Acidimicrobiales bacterium]